MNTDLVDYYRQRAKEYELIYQKPERQASLLGSANILEDLFSNKQVLEIACGTGYWTERIAKTAASIIATDINASVIDIAKSKDYGTTAVTFIVEDLYNRPPGRQYDALFGGFIWSHIPFQNLENFIEKVNSLVRPGGLVVLMDNIFVEGSSTAIDHVDENGNSWQKRKLTDGSEHLVLKNFPDESFLRRKLGREHHEIGYHGLDYYWIVAYKVG